MRIALFVFLLISSQVLASPAEEKKVRSIPILDTAKEILGTRISHAADRLDSFFATDRADDEFGRSQLRLRSRADFFDKEQASYDNSYRFNFKLPSLEKRFRPEYYATDEERAKAAEEKEKKKIEEEEKRKKRKGFFANWVFNSDVSASVAIPPKLIFRARVRKDFKTGTLKHYFTQQLTYTTDASGFVSDTSLQTDHTYSDDFIFRFVNNISWEITPKYYQTTHGPTWLYQATEDDAFNYGALMHTIIDSGPWHVDNYQFFLNYRRNLYQQWVYLDITPGLNFPEKWAFTSTPYIKFQLELLFGGN